MGELRPGEFARILGEVTASAEARSRLAVTRLSVAVQRRARDNLVKAGTHRRGTPTPATRGGPPALVTGTLRRSVVYTQARQAGIGGWEALVGTAAGIYPPGGHTPASLYGKYLETLLDFPWLLPAWKDAIRTDAPRIWREVFGGGKWTR